MSTTKHRGSAPSSHTEGLCVSVTVLEETGTTLRDRSGLVLISGGEEGGREGGTFVLESLTGRENLCERRVCVKREGGRGGGVTICECETSNCWTSHWTLF